MHESAVPLIQLVLETSHVDRISHDTATSMDTVNVAPESIKYHFLYAAILEIGIMSRQYTIPAEFYYNQHLSGFVCYWVRFSYVMYGLGWLTAIVDGLLTYCCCYKWCSCCVKTCYCKSNGTCCSCILPSVKYHLCFYVNQVTYIIRLIYIFFTAVGINYISDNDFVKAYQPEMTIIWATLALSYLACEECTILTLLQMIIAQTSNDPSSCLSNEDSRGVISSEVPLDNSENTLLSPSEVPAGATRTINRSMYPRYWMINDLLYQGVRSNWFAVCMAAGSYQVVIHYYEDFEFTTTVLNETRTIEDFVTEISDYDPTGISASSLTLMIFIFAPYILTGGGIVRQQRGM